VFAGSGRGQPNGRPPGQHQQVADPGRREDQQHDRDHAHQPGRDLAPAEVRRHGVGIGGQGPGEPGGKLGDAHYDQQQLAAQERDHGQHPRGQRDPGRPFQRAQPRIGRLARDQAAQHRPDSLEQIGHPDQVGQDEIPIQPQRGDQLFSQLHLGQPRGH
jgi:hypothetical protein